ncbi:MAG: hypothetical protein P1V35_12600 [Planctomycetota bacterium]|nr:hypothetical protein [Planctomycetota bacterium]
MTRHNSILVLPALLLGLSSSALAQGDTCSTAQDISGSGSFAFDNSTFTTSGFTGGGGCLHGNHVRNDGFYRWTAPAAGHFVFDINGSQISGSLGVHAGSSCTALCVDATYNSPGSIGKIKLLDVAAGDVYLVQVGSHSNGVLQLEITEHLDLCGTALDDAFEDNESCATAAPVDAGTYVDLLVSKTDKDLYSLTIAPGEALRVGIQANHFVTGVGVRLWSAADTQCGTGTGLTTVRSRAFVNTQAVAVPIVIEVTVDASARFDCSTYDMVVARTSCDSSAGQTFCCPANLNGAGSPTRLSGSFGSGVGSGLHLEAQGGPADEIGYFLIGTEAQPGIPVSNGNFCLVGAGGSFWRYNVAGSELNSIGRFDANGLLQNLSGTSTTGSGYDVPADKPYWNGTVEPILVGQTWHFQLWYRDTPAGVGTSNFSNGLSVMF